MGKKVFNSLVLLLVISTCIQKIFYFRGVGSQIQFTEFIFIAIIPFFPWKIWFKEKFFIRNKLFSIFTISYLASNIISALLSNNFFSVLEALGRVYLVGLFIVTYTYLKQFEFEKRIYIIQYTCLVLGAALAIFSLSGYLFLIFEYKTVLLSHYIDYPYFGTIYRLKGPTYSPTMLATILTMCFFLSIDNKNILSNHRHTLIFLRILIAVALILTFSKTILLFFWGGVLWLSYKLNYLKLKLIFLSAAVVIPLFFISSHFIFIKNDPYTIKKYINKVYFPNILVMNMGHLKVYESTYLTLKKIAIKTTKKNHLFGVGPGRFNQELSEQKKYNLLPSYIRNYDPHSSYTGALAETGIIGMISLTGLLFSIYRRLLVKRRLLITSYNLLLFIVCTFFFSEAISTDIMNFRHFWIFVAIIISTT